MKYTPLLLILAGIACSAGAATTVSATDSVFDNAGGGTLIRPGTNAPFLSVAATYNINGNNKYRGPGGTIRLGAFTPQWYTDSAIALEFDYVHLRSKTFTEGFTQWKPVAQGAHQARAKVDEYMLLLSFNLFGHIAGSKASWYLGLAAGANWMKPRLFVNTLNAEGAVVSASRPRIDHRVAPVGKVTLGLACHCNDNLTLYAAANALLTERAFRGGDEDGAHNTRPYQFAGEVGLGLKF